MHFLWETRTSGVAQGVAHIRFPWKSNRKTEFSYIACAVCFRFCVWRGIGEIQAALLPRSATHRQVRFAMSFGVNGFLCNLCTGSFQISARQRPGAKVSSRSYKIGFERPKLWDFSKSYIRLILKTGTLGPF
jgi:hypothetical protein